MSDIMESMRSARARIAVVSAVVVAAAAVLWMMSGGPSSEDLIKGRWADASNRRVQMEVKDAQITMLAGFRHMRGSCTFVDQNILEADFSKAGQGVGRWRLSLTFSEDGNTLTTTSNEGHTRTWRRVP